MKIAIGADHGGFILKQEIVETLEKLGYEFEDVGTFSTDSCDYPVIAHNVCSLIQRCKCDLGILVCGTGIGMSIAANKHKNIRAAVCSEHFSTKYTKLHNNSNVLCLGARVIGAGLAIELCELFLKTEFEGGRHNNRVEMLESFK